VRHIGYGRLYLSDRLASYYYTESVPRHW